jgi:nucleoid DNA-binding protein
MTTKTKLIHNLKNKLNYLSKEDVEFSINTVLDYVKEELVRGNRIEIRNFGSFSIRERKYSSQDDKYNVVYYRMAKSIQDSLK